jgi:hypothetical protein
MLSTALTQPGAKALTYLHSAKTASRVKPVTHWVAADLSHQRGRSLAAAAVGFLQDVEDEYEPAQSRVALLLAPKGPASTLDVAVATALKVSQRLAAFFVCCVCCVGAGSLLFRQCLFVYALSSARTVLLLWASCKTLKTNLPAQSRVALLLAPKGPASTLDVAVATALKVSKRLHVCCICSVRVGWFLLHVWRCCRHLRGLQARWMLLLQHR